MLKLPPPVSDYAWRAVIEGRRPAWLRVTPDGRFADCGGDLAAYGLGPSPHAAEAVFLEGLLPLRGVPVFLPSVETQSRRPADLHLIPGPVGDWVLLLDATEAVSRQREVQQGGYEAAFARGRLSRLLDQYVGTAFSRDLVSGSIPVREEGERRELTILFADIAGFTPYCEVHTPQEVFRTLDACLKIMILPVMAHGGTVDKIIGDAVMGLFGLLPSEEVPAVRALTAAFAMMDAMAASPLTVASAAGKLEFGIGIATGSVALGVLGNSERKSVSVIGHTVNLAARLEGHTRPREILIDQRTHSLSAGFRDRFHPTTLEVKGISRPVQAYSCTVHP